ncbi:sulfatase-like hydrolase/transferase [Olleya sp. R77988]|uniref:sulfatase-like hydrolase/transferase n=1 Tax=Olleya sp. R77988 TaxID=3093875 RepID=UPI0037C586B6
MKQRIINFINSDKDFPVLTGIASGLYPLLYYYNTNYTQVNSVNQFLFFCFYYILIPVFVFIGLYFLSKKIKVLQASKIKLFAVLNIGWFGYLILLSTIGVRLKFLILVCLIAFAFAVFFSKHFKKVIVFQLLMAVMSLVLLIPNIIRHVTYSSKWMEQPDDIESVVFKQTPNIYFIQADGYANVEELGKGYYNYDNSTFNDYLNTNGFKNYKNYRSNYYSTLSSNSSLFGMKHHYHSKPQKPFEELLNARSIIVNNNPVLRILKNNNYKTHLLMDKAYFLINKPKIGYDYCNVGLDEIPFITRGGMVEKNLKADIIKVLPENSDSNNFYFIQKLLPSHVTNSSADWAKKDNEKLMYLKRLEEANVWLKEVVALIENKDKNALIVISADHGGFVGFNTTLDSQIKQTDRDLIYSIYTSLLAIKWNDQPPSFENKLKTPVNFFRILFSYLSQDDKYLSNLEEDNSYIILNKGTPFGVYQYINNQGTIDFKPLPN